MLYSFYSLCPYCKHNESAPVKNKGDNVNVCLKCGKIWNGKLFKIFSVEHDIKTKELKFQEKSLE